MTEADECTCGRYHSASKFTCYKCGKLVPPVKKPEVVSVGISEMAQPLTVNEAKAYVISDSQEMLNFYKETWNAAIGAAATLTHNRGSNQCMRAAIEIRKLKK